jgi:hypothetical protein
MTQHRDIDTNSLERGSNPGGLSASFVDLMKSGEGMKGGADRIAQAGDYLTFNGDQAFSPRYGGTAFLSHPPETGINQTAFLTPKIQVNTSSRLDGKPLV